jgi:hypothetical protein
MNKKLIFILLACITLSFASCNEKDDYAPSLSVQILAGEWIMTVPEFFIENYGYPETWTLRTSNTNDNSSKALLLNDDETFWSFVVTVPAEPWGPSFGIGEDDLPVVNQYYVIQNGIIVYNPYDEKFLIKNGIVTPKAVTLPSGWKADKISFTFGIEDGAGGFEEFRMVGYRLSGFLEDEGYVYYEE